MIKVTAVQDESSHWYLIPSEMKEEFYRLHNQATDDDYEAQEKFMKNLDQYRTGGDVNGKQLYVETL